MVVHINYKSRPDIIYTK